MKYAVISFAVILSVFIIYQWVKLSNQKKEYLKQEEILENKHLVTIWFNRMSNRFQGEELDKKFDIYLKRRKVDPVMKAILSAHYKYIKESKPMVLTKEEDT